MRPSAFLPASIPAAVAVLALCVSGALFNDARAAGSCVPAGEWVVPNSGGGKRVAATDVLADAAKSAVVLLGESHDDMEHHRWQLQTLAALSATRGRLMIGFESFPRRVQPVLDRWVAGELSEAEFLAQSDWRKVWNMDAQLYLPLFHFARMNRIPMLALNVESDLVRSISRNGLQSVPEDKREGVGKAAPAAPAYLDRLFASYAAHPDKSDKGRKPGRSDPEFQRFVDAQQFWDRAMAQVIADATRRDPKALVVGVMGAEHVARGYGVVHQLAGLGITSVTSLLPWDMDADCKNLQAGLATAVFGVPDLKESAARPRLGIRIEVAPDGVRVVEMSAGSLAESSGLRANDVLTEAAGKALKLPGDLVAIVAGMPAGTWLPLKAKRDGQVIELVAKFPPAKP